MQRDLSAAAASKKDGDWPNNELIKHAATAVVTNSNAVQNRLTVEARTQDDVGLDIDDPQSLSRTPVSRGVKGYSTVGQPYEDRLRIRESPPPPPSSSPGPNMAVSHEPTLQEEQLLKHTADTVAAMSLEPRNVAVNSSLHAIKRRSVHKVGSEQTRMVAASSPVLDSKVQPLKVHTRTISNMSIPASNDAHGMLCLMNTCRGRMQGPVYFRLHGQLVWSKSFCSISENGSLRSQVESAETLLATLAPDLRGCRVHALYDDDVSSSILQVSTRDRAVGLEIRPVQKEYLNAWFAAILCWQPIAKGCDIHDFEAVSHLQQLQSSADNRDDTPIRGHAVDNEQHSQSSPNSRFGLVNNAIVQMIFEHLDDIPLTSSASSDSSISPAIASKQSWEMQISLVSCTLRVHGQLEIQSHDKNKRFARILLQMREFSCCAIQRLDRSVFNLDYVLAVYPQYASSDTSTSRVRPLYLRFRSSEQLDTWFALLRLFAKPEIYGSRAPQDFDPYTLDETLPGVDPGSASGLFRVERSLEITLTKLDLTRQTRLEHRQSGIKSDSSADPFQGPTAMLGAEIILDEQVHARTSLVSLSQTPAWAKDCFVVRDLPSLSPLVTIRVKRLLDQQHSQDPKARPQSHSSKFASLGRSTKLRGVESQLSRNEHITGEAIVDTLEMKDQSSMDGSWSLVADSVTVGTIGVKIKRVQKVVLMDNEYERLVKLLKDYDNDLPYKIWQQMPLALYELAERFLNIFQASDRALTWLLHLVRQEIELGIRKPTTINIEANSPGADSGEIRKFVSDEEQSDARDVSLLFRANTLLTKSLDSYMKRVGRQYLQDTIGAKLNEVMSNGIDYEVNPSKLAPADEVDIQWNWRHLVDLTKEIWRLIYQSPLQCPIEIKIILRRIQSYAVRRYGHVAPSVAYTSVTGFLFLRFFVAAIMTPQAFGLVEGMTS